MGIHQIHDMDIVADAGPVAGRIVGTEHGQRWTLSVDGVKHQGNEMRFGPVELAHLAIRIGGDLPPGWPVRVLLRGQTIVKDDTWLGTPGTGRWLRRAAIGTRPADITGKPA